MNSRILLIEDEPGLVLTLSDLLAAEGVPVERITAIGRGASDGPDASLTGGVFDEAKVQAKGLRRVVVTVKPLP